MTINVEMTGDGGNEIKSVGVKSRQFVFYGKGECLTWFYAKVYIGFYAGYAVVGPEYRLGHRLGTDGGDSPAGLFFT